MDKDDGRTLALICVCQLYPVDVRFDWAPPSEKASMSSSGFGSPSARSSYHGLRKFVNRLLGRVGAQRMLCGLPTILYRMGSSMREDRDSVPDLFGPEQRSSSTDAPLADRMRPRSLAWLVGQDHCL